MQACQHRRLRIRFRLHAQPAALVRLADQREFIDPTGLAESVATLDQVVHGVGAKLVEAMDVEVFPAAHDGQVAVVGGHLVAFANHLQGFESGMFVVDVAGQLIGGRQRLAQVMRQRGEADPRIARRNPGGHVANHLCMQARIDLGMELHALRHAEQRIHLGQQARQRAAVSQHSDEGRRAFGCQRALHFLPHALGHQMVHLATLDHLAHQLQGFRRDRKPE